MTDHFLLSEKHLRIDFLSIYELNIDNFHYSKSFGSAYKFNSSTIVTYEGKHGMKRLIYKREIINIVIYTYNGKKEKLYSLHNFL